MSDERVRVFVQQRPLVATVRSTGQRILIPQQRVRLITVSKVGPTGALAPAFEQTFSATLSWTVNHNLGRLPHVTVMSLGGAEMIADVLHVSVNQVVIYHASPTAGKVRCL